MAIPWKAVFAFIAAFCVSFLAFVQDKTSFDDLTGFQWMVAVLSSVVVAGGVYVLPK